MKHRSINGMLITCFTWLAITATPDAHAFFVSAKNAGMGLTGAANAQDAETAAFNPANATAIGTRSDLGFAWEHISGRAINTGNPIPGANGNFDGTTRRNFYAPDGGFNTNFCFCGHQIAVGFVSHNQDSSKTRYRMANPLLGTTPPGLEFVRVKAAPYIAIKFDPNDWCDLGCYADYVGTHSIGVSVNILGQRLKINGLENYIPFSVAPDSVTDREYNYSWGCGTTIGWRGEWCDWLAVGFAFTPRAHMGRLKRYAGFTPNLGEAQSPQKILAGFAINYFPCTTIAFDVEFIDWRHAHSLGNHFSLPPPVPLGANNGIAFGWKKQTIYHVGLDYQALDCLTLRAGYIHLNPLFKGDQTPPNVLLLQTITDFVTVGASYQWNQFEFTLAYLHGFKRGVSGPIPVVLGGGTTRLELVRDVTAFSIGYNF